MHRQYLTSQRSNRKPELHLFSTVSSRRLPSVCWDKPSSFCEILTSRTTGSWENIRSSRLDLFSIQ